MSSPHERIVAWYMAGNTGISSESILRAYLGEAPRWPATFSYPSDTGDLARCLQLLQHVPEARIGITRLASHPQAYEWQELDAIWDALAAHGCSDGLLEWRGTFGAGRSTTAELLQTALDFARTRRRKEKATCDTQN